MRNGKLVTRVLSNRKLWRFVMLPVMLGGAAVLALTLYHGSQGPNLTSNITVLTKSNASTVSTDMQNWQSAGKPVFFELCTGSECTTIDQQLNPVAGQYKGQIMFIQADPTLVPSLVQQGAQLSGTTAYPMSLLMTASAGYAQTGILTSQQLTDFIKSSTGTTNVVTMNSSNESQVMQALQGAKTNVLFVIGTPDVFRAEQSYIDAEASKYGTSLIIVEVSPDTQLAQSVAQSMKAQVFPVWAFENTNGGQLIVPGMVGSTANLDQLIQAGLKAKPQTSSPSGSGSTSGTTGSTATPGSTPTTAPGSGK